MANKIVILSMHFHVFVSILSGKQQREYSAASPPGSPVAHIYSIQKLTKTLRILHGHDVVAPRQRDAKCGMGVGQVLLAYRPRVEGVFRLHLSPHTPHRGLALLQFSRSVSFGSRRFLLHHVAR